MIRVLTAHTTEIDDESSAIKDVLQKLDLGKNRLKNSIAMVYRHKYFSSEAFYKKLRQELQMELVALTTIVSATNGSRGTVSLSVLVLTSDNSEFITGISNAANGREANLREEFLKTVARANLPPKAVFVFSTPFYPVDGEGVAKILDEAGGQLPVFGAVSFCLPIASSEASLFYNDAFYTDSLAFILICGEFKATFANLTSPINKILVKDLIVTKAEKNILKEINDTPAADFLEKLGIVNGKISEISLLMHPLCVKATDCQKVIRVMRFINEDGSIGCHADLEEGSTFSVGLIENVDILNSMVRFFDENLSSKNENFIIFSCAIRSLALGLNFDEEMLYFSKKINKAFLFAYSGGEFCPTQNGRNCFFNASIVSCGFEENE
jgi:hypothetical protein